MGKKVTLFIGIICLIVGIFLASAYWIYPPFGETLTSTGILISTTVVTFVTSYQPIWIGMVAGGVIVGTVILTGHRIWVFIKGIGKQDTRRELVKAGLGSTPSSGTIVRANPDTAETAPIAEKVETA